jgi:hypothetical protein
MKHILCIVAFVLCSSEYASAQKQTLADIARRERSNRQAAQKTGPVTNAILTPKPAVAVEETAGPAATASELAPAAEPATAPATDSRDENWWRQQFDRARTEVRRAENQIEVAQLELNSANRDLLTRSYDPDGRGPAAVAAATARLDAVNKNVVAARAKVAQLEEELRRAGAPAGWSR